MTSTETKQQLDELVERFHKDTKNRLIRECIVGFGVVPLTIATLSAVTTPDTLRNLLLGGAGGFYAGICSSRYKSLKDAVKEIQEELQIKHDDEAIVFSHAGIGYATHVPEKWNEAEYLESEWDRRREYSSGLRKKVHKEIAYFQTISDAATNFSFRQRENYLLAFSKVITYLKAFAIALKLGRSPAGIAKDNARLAEINATAYQHYAESLEEATGRAIEYYQEKQDRSEQANFFRERIEEETENITSLYHRLSKIERAAADALSDAMAALAGTGNGS